MNITKKNSHLLETILAIRSSVGEGLSDDEITLLLRTTLLTEAGFSFLSFSRGLVTLTVPEQDLTNWYPEKGWIAPEKEMTARAIAEKYELSLYEPPDKVTSVWHAAKDPEVARHHILMSDGLQTVIVAHPQYLKVRVLGRSERYRYDWEATLFSASRPRNPAGPLSTLWAGYEAATWGGEAVAVRLTDLL